MDKQTDLFAEDHAFVGALFDNLDHIPDVEIANIWPSTLADLIEVVRLELCRQGLEDKAAKVQAGKITGVIAHYLGGQTIYMPSGDRLKIALRDAQIYQEFTGNNVHELIRKYRLSQTQIYEIIRVQRSLFRRRNQPELPFV